MDNTFFKGDRSSPITASEQNNIPASRAFEEESPEGYIASPELINAVNVALLLGKPLLLTGEPGTGKSRLADRVAWELGFELLKFETKSNSKASDLFYIYNMLGQFHAAQLHQKIDASEFITFKALGKAIIRTNAPEDLKDYLPKSLDHQAKTRSVVLIDEIDKAPRDFPNDILNEIENLFFKVPELGNIEFISDKSLSPIIIITSNSEKNLPPAFLRRVVFHHIDFPDQEQLEKIVATRLLQGNEINSITKEQIDYFCMLRKADNYLKKKPSTSELLLWIKCVREITKNSPEVSLNKKIIDQTIGVLIKSKEELELITPLIMLPKKRTRFLTLNVKTGHDEKRATKIQCRVQIQGCA